MSEKEMEYFSIDYGKDETLELENGLKIDVRIDGDQDGESPREWDNLGHMVCWHRNYNLGDEQPKYGPNEFWREMACQIDPTAAYRIEYWEYLEGSQRQDAEARIQNIIDQAVKDVVILPLYLYDHSGISMSTSYSYPYNDRWDAGQVGWIYATREDMLKGFGGKRITKKMRTETERILRGEVETYDMYLTNDIHCFSIDVYRDALCGACGHTGREEIASDSCCGIYGWKDVQQEVNTYLREYGVEISL